MSSSLCEADKPPALAWTTSGLITLLSGFRPKAWQFALALAGYAFAALLCSGIMFCELRLWKVDLHVPFCYAGDGLLNCLWVKAVIDNGWYCYSPRVGMPAGLEMHDFAVGDGFHFLFIKLISLACPDYAIVGNVYYLLGFPLATLSSLFVFRRLGVSYGPALLGGILYAFLPYHLFRITHLFLCAYYLIPFMVFVLLWVWAGEEILFPRDKGSKGVWRSRRTLSSVLICILTASGGIYYAFFACGLLLAAGVAAAVRLKRWYFLVQACSLTGILVVAGLVNISPTLWYTLEHGKNTEAGRRDFGEADNYGLRIAQLILPVTGHRIDALARLNTTYNRFATGNENNYSTLGLFGSAGFLLLLSRSLFGRLAIVRPGSERIASSAVIGDGLASLNLFAVLLATVGGFGPLLDLAGFHNIRGYNRISVYIAFFSLCAVALLLEGARKRFAMSSKARLAFTIALALGGFLGIYDQCSRGAALPVLPAPHGPETVAQFYSDAAFVQELENRLPNGTMIYQLPHVSFPEMPKPTARMYDYEHFRGYFHSTALRWSYGAIRGRWTDQWQKWVDQQPLEEMVRTIIYTGFGGIYLNRNGYDEDDVDVERGLAKLLQQEPLISNDKSLAFFDLADFCKRLKASCSQEEWQRRQEHAAHPLLVSWSGNFSAEETNDHEVWRWCGNHGKLHLYNSSSHDMRVVLDMGCSIGRPATEVLQLESSFWSEQIEMSLQPTTISKVVTIPPGDHVLHFRCDAHPLHEAGEFRILVFRLHRPIIYEQDAPASTP